MDAKKLEDLLDRADHARDKASQAKNAPDDCRKDGIQSISTEDLIRLSEKDKESSE